MSDVADDSDPFITGEITSGIEAARARLLTREFLPTGACHYCTGDVGANMLYCDDECAAFHAHEIKRKKELGR